MAENELKARMEISETVISPPSGKPNLKIKRNIGRIELKKDKIKMKGIKRENRNLREDRTGYKEIKLAKFEEPFFTLYSDEADNKMAQNSKLPALMTHEKHGKDNRNNKRVNKANKVNQPNQVRNDNSSSATHHISPLFHHVSY